MARITTTSASTCAIHRPHRASLPPATILAPTLPSITTPLLTGAFLSLTSLTANILIKPLQIDLPKISLPSLPSLPNISLPSLPEVNLPFIGKVGGSPTKSRQSKIADDIKDEAKYNKRGSVKPRSPATANVRVKIGAGVTDRSLGKDAPTFAELQKSRGLGMEIGGTGGSLRAAEDEWKQFPLRRMPGANLEGWKKIAREMKQKK